MSTPKQTTVVVAWVDKDCKYQTKRIYKRDLQAFQAACERMRRPFVGVITSRKVKGE